MTQIFAMRHSYLLPCPKGKGLGVRSATLEQRARARPSQMRIRALGRDASALRARDESLLHQVGLVDFLDSIALFADRRREALDADWAAVELVDDGGEDRAIHFVEAHRVDFQK